MNVRIVSDVTDARSRVKTLPDLTGKDLEFP